MTSLLLGLSARLARTENQLQAMAAKRMETDERVREGGGTCSLMVKLRHFLQL